MSHTPVLLNETLELIEPVAGKFIIDGTANGGGHSQEILKKLGKNSILLSIDWDKKMTKELGEKLKSKSVKVVVKNSNYAEVDDILKKEKLPKADGLLLDLGFSSKQLEDERGFSFLKDEVLDMRYDNSADSLTAMEVVNTFDEKEIADIIYQFGEERLSRKIAKAIVSERKKDLIKSTSQLAQIIKLAVPKSYEKGRIHPATRTFQALRIYVNHELDNLNLVISKINQILNSKGRLVIISFHSLEDRIVKNKFREMEKEGLGKILTKKPIIAGEAEIKQNLRSRSAKLRAIEII